MKAQRIFEIDQIEKIEEGILSVKYVDERQNEFQRLFELWNDPEFLHSFFVSNIKDLVAANHIWPNIGIEEAIYTTRNSALDMEEHFYYMAKSGEMSRSKQNLSEFFVPLSDGHYKFKLDKNKAKGLEKNSWLRIYAIRLEPNLYVISGGCIKLNKKMPEEELTKLEITKEYIKNNISEF